MISNSNGTFPRYWLRSSLGVMIATIALVMLAAPVAANTWSLDFLSETWDHSAGGGPAANLGWADGELIGSTTVNGIGITVEFGFVGDTVGKAHSDNATYRNNPPGFVGFLWGLKAEAGLNTAPTLANYTTFTITFNQPVTGGIAIADFDERPQWRDGGGFEAFTGAVGAIGTGIAPDTTNLGANVTSTNVFPIEIYFASTIGGQQLGPDNAVSAEWLDPFTVIRAYLYNSQPGPMAGTIGFEFGVGVTGAGGNGSVLSIPTTSIVGSFVLFGVLVLVAMGVLRRGL